MKLPRSAIAWSLALAMASAAASTPPRGSNLHVKVHCPGVDFKEVSSEEGAAVGKILMETFQASRNPDIDDSSLTSLGFLGHDLEGAPSHTRVQFHPAYFYGTFDCKLCHEDTEKTFHQGWELNFANELATSGVDVFENVEACKIQYGLTGKPAEVPANAEINLKCEGIRVSGLSVAESTFVSHSLESTYNGIHRVIPGDESHLGDVFVEPKNHRSLLSTSESETHLSQAIHHCYMWIGCHWLDRLGGSYAPTFCFHDDIWWDDDLYNDQWKRLFMFSPEEENADDVTLSAEKVSKAWGDAFAARLRQGPFRVFHNIKSCELTLIADGALVASDVVVSTATKKN